MRSDEELTWRPLEKQRRESEELVEAIRESWNEHGTNETTDNCFIPMILLDLVMKHNTKEQE